MTAIFAYSSPNVAFVASDTLRAMPSSLVSLPAMTVCKGHFWSDQVVFGQAGTQFQGELIGAMKAAKKQFINPNSGAIHFDDSEHWLYKTFTSCQPAHHAQAVKKVGAPLSNGTLLVAYVDVASGGHGLSRYNFATGAREAVVGHVAADGTDATAFLAIAQKHLAALQARSGGPVHLDEWARVCLDEAIALHPTSVGWPADLVIARPHGLGGRQIVQRRINPNSAVGDPIFVV